MKRCSLALLTLVVSAACFAGSQGGSQDRGKKLELLQQEFDKARKEFILASGRAKTAEEKKAAEAKSPRTADYVAKALKIVEGNPKDDASFDALRFAYGITRGSDARVVDLLTENHAKNPKIKSACFIMIHGGPATVTKMLRKVLAENPDKEAKGFACLALGSILAAKVDNGDEASALEAEKLLNRVIADFAAIKVGKQGTLGETAKGVLFELRYLRIGKIAPNFVSHDWQGNKVQLKDYRGKVVVLDFWATWCGPCKAMIPHARELVQKLKDQQFALIDVSVDAKLETLTKFLKKEPMPWAHWWAGDESPMTAQWNVNHFPTIYVLDAQGVVRYKEVRDQDLEKAVMKLLREAHP